MNHRLELGGCSIGAGFLEKPKRDTQHHHSQHQHAAGVVGSGLRRRESNCRQHRQQDYQRVQARFDKQLEARKVLLIAHRIWTIRIQPPLSFRLAKTLLSGL